jgi:hypothetical protein
MSRNRIAVTDARALACSGSPDDLPSVELLASVLRSLERFGYDVILVVDQELRRDIERSDSCTDCLERVTICIAPDGVDRQEIVVE